jgi:hypothetical protein
MRIKKSYDESIVEFVGGGGAGSIIVGIFLFLGAGVLVAAHLSHVLPPETAGIVYVFGSIILFLSIVFMFGRGGVKIDTSFGEVNKWWGFVFLPLYSSKRNVSDFMHIQITKQAHHSKNGTHYTYPVSMLPESGKEYIINNQGVILKARTFAETSAKAMKLSLIDNSGPVEVERNYDELDMSIREQAAQKGEMQTIEDAGEMPVSLKTFGGIKNGNLLLEMPPGGLGRILKKLLFLPIFIAFVMLAFFLTHIFSGTEGRIPLFVFFIVIAFVILPLPFVVIAMSKKFACFGDVTQIYASRNKFEICYGKRKMEWNAADIEELLLLPCTELPENIPEFAKAFAQTFNGGITVRSDKLYATFAQRFNESEQEWIYKILYAILAGGK